MSHSIHIEKCGHCNRIFIRLKHGEYQRDRIYYWITDPDLGVSGNPVHGEHIKDILLL